MTSSLVRAAKLRCRPKRELRPAREAWQSYAGTFVDTTLPVVMRAIVLEALGQSIGADAVALSTRAIARNLLPPSVSRPDRRSQYRRRWKNARSLTAPNAAKGRSSLPTTGRLADRQPPSRMATVDLPPTRETSSSSGLLSMATVCFPGPGNQGPLRGRVYWTVSEEAAWWPRP